MGLGPYGKRNISSTSPCHYRRITPVPPDSKSLVRAPVQLEVRLSFRTSRVLLRCAPLILILLRPLVFGHFPRLVGIVSVDALECLQCVRPKIFLINNSIWSNHKAFHTSHTVFRRRGHEAETADHGATDDEV